MTLVPEILSAEARTALITMLRDAAAAGVTVTTETGSYSPSHLPPEWVKPKPDTELVKYLYGEFFTLQSNRRAINAGEAVIVVYRAEGFEPIAFECIRDAKAETARISLHK